MKELYRKIKEVLEQGQSFVLVSVILTVGSTPRGNGARMAVFEDGHVKGTIGGGAVEYMSIQKAKDILKSKQSGIESYDLSHGNAKDIGMVCGGTVTVCFQYVEPTSGFLGLTDVILNVLDQNMDSWLVTEIVDGIPVETGIYDATNGLQYLPESTLNKIRFGFKGQSLWIEGNPSYFIDPLTTAGYAYIFGGGHVAQALVPVIAGVGFKPVIYEDREEFTHEELFESVYKTVLGKYTEINENIHIGEKDYVIVMTRGHQSDFEVLTQVLKTPACYIGVMGSRTKIAVTRERLLVQGFTKKDMERIHTPIGLAIKAQTPAEIAISVAAELILTRANIRGE